MKLIKMVLGLTSFVLLSALPSSGVSTNFYHTNRVFRPVLFTNLGPSVSAFNAKKMLGQFTTVVGPTNVIVNTNNTFAKEYEAMAWGYPSASAAWSAVASNYLNYSQTYPTATYDNVGWVKGTHQAYGDWGAYLWLMQNQSAFKTSATNIWVSPNGQTNFILQVLVSSLGDYLPMANVVEIGPTNWGIITNYPGAESSTDVFYKADFTTYYELLLVRFTRDGGCSGFDDTLFPPWIMIPNNNANSAIASLWPKTATNKVCFQSANSGIVSVSPSISSVTNQLLTITGVTKNDTEIYAMPVGSSIASAILNVSVRDRRNKTIAIHAITEENDDVQVAVLGTTGLSPTNVVVGPGPNGFRDTPPDGDDVVSPDNLYVLAGPNGIADTLRNNVSLVPSDVPSASALENYLNNDAWGRQANVYFTVTRSDYVINYDLDRNTMLNDPYELPNGTQKNPLDWGEIDVISPVAKDMSVDYNVYYVADYEYPVALTEIPRGEVWIGDLKSGTVEYITAHEIGHCLGIVGHAGRITHLHLMAPYDSSSSPCQTLKIDWDVVNQ